MEHERSPPRGETHQAAVRSPSTASHRQAGHRRPAHQDVPVLTDANARANGIHECITGLLCTCGRARLVGIAASVHLRSRDPRQPNARSLCAPDRPVAVPYVRRRAGEGLTGGHRHGSCEEEAHRLNLARLPEVPVEREKQEHRPEGEHQEPPPRCRDRHRAHVKHQALRQPSRRPSKTIFLHGTISEHGWSLESETSHVHP